MKASCPLIWIVSRRISCSRIVSGRISSCSRIVSSRISSWFGLVGSVRHLLLFLSFCLFYRHSSTAKEWKLLAYGTSIMLCKCLLWIIKSFTMLFVFCSLPSFLLYSVAFASNAFAVKVMFLNWFSRSYFNHYNKLKFISKAFSHWSSFCIFVNPYYYFSLSYTYFWSILPKKRRRFFLIVLASLEISYFFIYAS